MGQNESQLGFKCVCYLSHDSDYGELATEIEGILNDSIEGISISKEEDSKATLIDKINHDIPWNFTDICEILTNSLNFCILLTEYTLRNKHCLVQLCVAVMEGLNIIPVVLYGQGIPRFQIPTNKQKFLLGYPQGLSEETVKFLHMHNLLVQDCMRAIELILDDITHVFDASASPMTRTAQIKDITRLLMLNAPSVKQRPNDGDERFPLPLYLAPDRSNAIREESGALLSGTAPVSYIYAGFGIDLKEVGLEENGVQVEREEPNGSNRKQLSVFSSLQCRSSTKKFRSLRKSKKKRKVLLVGLDNSGKTSLLFALKTHFGYQATDPTIGFNLETISYGGIKFNIFDLSGQKDFRTGWKQYLEGCCAVMFVVDCSDRERLEEACEEFSRFKSDVAERLEGTASILVYANKQDVPDSIKVTELYTRLKLYMITENNWYIQSCSSKTMDGIFEGLEWIRTNLYSST